ncbi:hypothetical protein CWR48_05045 [Oceanobacillus arenosus]|uniref:Type I restriction modification DNA specificity domain-containing protein n=1 Tax=Oceanobacillus arenosus TaxID=1229153 RepID=A0A3D8PWE9_9BACI|nr:restriction endonuclease subunit S [Oceanobacillus arenosus]RDW20092.1 hypothetical protein CWR48_05045 [Oceanobacillus arenosus]
MIKDSIDNIFDFISEVNITEEYIYNNKGIYPVYTGQTGSEDATFCIDTYIIDGEYLTFTTYGSAGKLNFRSGKGTIGRNCMGLKPKEEFFGKINLEWFSYKFQNKFYRLRIGDVSGQKSLNKLLLSNVEVVIPEIDKQLEELKVYKKVKNLSDKISALILDLNKISEINIKSDQTGEKEKLKKIFTFTGGNGCLTEEFIYLNRPRNVEESIPILSGATMENNSMGSISKYAKDSDGKNIKVFKGPCIIVTRNGYYAGTMSYIKEDVEFTINDHAYVMKIKDKWANKIDLFWFMQNYQELFFNLVTSKSDNATFNKTYAEAQMINIPDIELQREITNKVKPLKENISTLVKIKNKLFDLIEYEVN